MADSKREIIAKLDSLSDIHLIAVFNKIAAVPTPHISAKEALDAFRELDVESLRQMMDYVSFEYLVN